MKLIAAGLGHRVDGAGGVLAVLRRYRACLHLELLQHIRKREGQTQIVVGIVVRPSVQQIGQTVIHSASDGNGLRGVISIGGL